MSLDDLATLQIREIGVNCGVKTVLMPYALFLRCAFGDYIYERNIEFIETAKEKYGENPNFRKGYYTGICLGIGGSLAVSTPVLCCIFDLITNFILPERG